MAETAGNNPPDKREKYLTKKEVAELLRTSTRTVEKMLKRREVSHTKPLGRVLVPASEVEGLLAGSWVSARKPGEIE